MDRSNGSEDETQKLHRKLAIEPKTGLVLEDYRPVFECLEFRLSRRFWNLKGADAFLGGDVPYVVTNDGHLAANGVTTFLVDLDPSVDEFNLLEIGAGSGLFAKQFMDQLRDSAPDIYARTRYHATDGSEAMVRAWDETGVFSDHEDHIEGRLTELPGLSAAFPSGIVFHAAFANYILDSLPFTLLAMLDQDVWELEFRTALDAGVDPEPYVGLTEQEIASRVARGRPEDLDALVDIYPALVLDTRYRPIDRDALVLGETLPPPTKTSDERAKPYLHSYGALQAIRDVMDCLAPGGFLAVADYGHSLTSEKQDVFEFQHFGGSTAMGLNFETMDRVCTGWDDIDVVAPQTDNGQLVMRLIGRNVGAQTRDTFLHVAGTENWDRLTLPLQAAQQLTSDGQFEAARWKYEEALRLQPHNWALIEEIASFLTYRLEAYEAGLLMAKAGIERNSLSPILWNIAGDCLFYTDHLNEARDAFLKANAVSPRDVRSVLNLAWVATRLGQDTVALDLIAQGLATDQSDAFRDALLAKQTEILDRRTARQGSDSARSANRIRGHRDLPRRA